MTMGHPGTRIGHIDEYIHVLSSGDQDSIFPDEIGTLLTIGIQHDESLTMHMEWVLHRMHRVSIIGYTDLHEISLAELPVDIHIGLAGGVIGECPEYILTITLIVHHSHRIFPLYRII